MKPTSSLSACLANAKKTLTPPTKKAAVKSTKPPKPSKPPHTKDADQLGSSGGGSISFNG